MNAEQFIMNAPPELVALAIILAAFVSEDAATLAAASLAAMNTLEPRLAFGSSVAGIWLGDLGLYALSRSFGRKFLDSRWVRRTVRPETVARGERWFARQGSLALFLSRCIPGTRLPISVAAGALRMPVGKFATVGAVGALAWVALNFAVVAVFQRQLKPYVGVGAWTSVLLALLLFGIIILTKKLGATALARVRLTLTRWSRWEFWPAWLFYLPVAGMYAWLGARYRGYSLPAIANPRQVNGGLVGESKAQILEELRRAAPEHVAEGFLLDGADSLSRLYRLGNLVAQKKLDLPFVLKPNVGQRGAGFRKITRIEQAIQYVRSTPTPLIAQQYVAGAKEVGVFYFRFPGQQRGEILAITEKSFPTVAGDGTRTLRELILADTRASMIAATYLCRFAESVNQVIPAGTQFRLVEAGNHCQGCVFGEGMHLYTPALRDILDRISQVLPEFYIGRYDIRYANDDDLRAGKDFTIIELNGASSEATNIYDERNTLWAAYRMLYRQWKLVFEIGSANRARGFRPPTLLSLAIDWLAYSRQSAYYPAAD